jgi:UDP-N-acetylmuramoyl-tripeptide--D-alanyl-D-alanine ligase
MITAAWIAEAVGGRLHRPKLSVRITKFSIDTRTLQAGDFFIALVGSQIDGHRFLADAFARGASGALVHTRDTASRESAPWHNVVEVENTFAALHRLARAYRAQFEIPVLAVTGSCGKTTTKELIAHLLCRRFATYRSPGNLNTEYGLPLALLEMPLRTCAGVFELGMQRPGEIRALADILQPTVGLITMIGDAHLEFFRCRDEIADAKWELIASLPRDGLAVLNRNSEYLRARRYAGRTVWFGLGDPGADYRISQLDAAHPEGLVLQIETPHETFDVRSKLLGRHNALNILGACAVASELGLSGQEIQQALPSFRTAPHRMELKRSPWGWVLDDSYNANPSAVKEALQTLQALRVPADRKIFIFGEMRELGTHAPWAHYEIGRCIAQTNIAKIFTLGELTAHTTRYLLEEAGWSQDRIRSARDRAELLNQVRANLTGTRNLILVKGSRAMELDKVGETLVGGEAGLTP